MTDPIKIQVDEKATGQRLDKWLSNHVSDLSRSRLQQLIVEGCLTHEGKQVGDAAQKVKAGQVFFLTIPEVRPLGLTPVSMPLDIVFEDEHLLVINKQAGLTVHPAAGTKDQPTLVHALLAYCGDSLSGIGGVSRPGIVHRLDKDTSGLILAAKHDKAHQHLSHQLKDRSLSRTYQAICWGAPSPSQGTIDAAVGRHPVHRKKMAILKTGGRDARTHYQVKEKFFGGEFALVECKLETGRTHQIRVHLASLGHPLLGDALYGGVKKAKSQKNAPEEWGDTMRLVTEFPRQALHALAISFIHPISGNVMTFETALPPDIIDIIYRLKDLHR